MYLWTIEEPCCVIKTHITFDNYIVFLAHHDVMTYNYISHLFHRNNINSKNKHSISDAQARALIVGYKR